jgi:D-alanine transaminase
MATVYLNGEFLPADEARISVDDRGFLFGDGIYEVTPAYAGNFLRFPQHMARMERGLNALRLDYDRSGLAEVHRRLIEGNGLSSDPTAYVYVQVTRGVAPRSHAFPKDPVPPTVYAFASRFQRPSDERWAEGFSAVTVPDRRWARVDLKTIALLPNCLAQQAAVDAGVEDALFVKDGIALEGSHNNLFAVYDGVLTTHPASHEILHGITRALVIELAQAIGIDVVERPMPIEEFARADEVFFTGTTVEIRPTIRVDGRPVGGGRVGPVTRAIREAFVAATDRVAGATPVTAG